MVLAMKTDKRESAVLRERKGGSVYRGTHLYSLPVRKVLLHVHLILFGLVVPKCCRHTSIQGMIVALKYVVSQPKRSP
jgi:hypothetical protein